jgi:hypothetical protein
VVSASAGVEVEVQPAAFLSLADTGGLHLVWPAVAGVLTLGATGTFVAAHGRRG